MKIAVSHDRNHVLEVRKAIQENGGYCPCTIFKNRDTLCPCRDFREQQIPGPCHCGLYVKTEY